MERRGKRLGLIWWGKGGNDVESRRNEKGRLGLGGRPYPSLHAPSSNHLNILILLLLHIQYLKLAFLHHIGSQNENEKNCKGNKNFNLSFPPPTRVRQWLSVGWKKLWFSTFYGKRRSNLSISMSIYLPVYLSFFLAIYIGLSLSQRMDVIYPLHHMYQFFCMSIDQGIYLSSS